MSLEFKSNYFDLEAMTKILKDKLAKSTLAMNQILKKEKPNIELENKQKSAIEDFQMLTTK